MDRKPVVLLAVIVLTGFVVGGSFLRAGAQDSTAPIPTDWGVPGFEVLSAQNDLSLAPGMSLELGRLTWEPGFTIDLHTHPAIDAIYVFSGSVAWSVANGTAQVTRATVAGTPGPTEALEAGGEAVLEPGDAIAFDYPKTGMDHGARVVGEVPVVMLLATLYDPSQPLTTFAGEGGTPNP